MGDEIVALTSMKDGASRAARASPVVVREMSRVCYARRFRRHALLASGNVRCGTLAA